MGGKAFGKRMMPISIILIAVVKKSSLNENVTDLINERFLYDNIGFAHVASLNLQSAWNHDIPVNL